MSINFNTKSVFLFPSILVETWVEGASMEEKGVQATGLTAALGQL